MEIFIAFLISYFFTEAVLQDNKFFLTKTTWKWLKMRPHMARVWWHQLWIRKDEFHHSLSMDIEAMIYMDTEETKIYLEKLNKRRETARQRNF